MLLDKLKANAMHAACMVDGIDQFSFVVALAKVQRPAVNIARLLAQCLHIGQRGCAINGRLAATKQVEVGAV